MVLSTFAALTLSCWDRTRGSSKRRSQVSGGNVARAGLASTTGCGQPRFALRMAIALLHRRADLIARLNRVRGSVAAENVPPRTWPPSSAYSSRWRVSETELPCFRCWLRAGWFDGRGSLARPTNRSASPFELRSRMGALVALMDLSRSFAARPQPTFGLDVIQASADSWRCG